LAASICCESFCFRSSDVSAMTWRGPGERWQEGSAALLVSNNPYRFGPAVGAGTRPRLDQGLLGVATVGAPGDRPFRAWATTSFDVDAHGPVPAGLDGEAVLLEPPLRFRTRRQALRVHIARHHPGASPSALAPERAWAAIRALLDIAAGRG